MSRVRSGAAALALVAAGLVVAGQAVPAQAGPVRASAGAAATEADPFANHGGEVDALTFGNLGGRPVLASGGTDNKLRTWDLATRAPVGQSYVSVGQTYGYEALSTTTLGTRRVVVSVPGAWDWNLGNTVQVSDLATGIRVRRPCCAAGVTQALAVTTLAGRRVAVTGGTDGYVHVWDLATGAEVGSPMYHGNVVLSLAVATVGRRQVVVAGDFGSVVKVWNLSTRRQEGADLADSQLVTRMQVTRVDGRSVVLLADDDYVRAVDLGTCAQVGQTIALAGFVQGLGAVPVNGRPTVVTVLNGEIRRSDLLTGAELPTLMNGDARALAVATVGGRPLAATGGSDGVVHLWDLAAGTEITSITG
jgi:WD40 repeat protein